MVRNRRPFYGGEDVNFYHTPEQKLIATASKRQLQLSGKFQQDIVTLIEPAGDYYLADQSHQQYLEKKLPRAVEDFQKKI